MMKPLFAAIVLLLVFTAAYSYFERRHGASQEPALASGDVSTHVEAPSPGIRRAAAAGTETVPIAAPPVAAVLTLRVRYRTSSHGSPASQPTLPDWIEVEFHDQRDVPLDDVERGPLGCFRVRVGPDVSSITIRAAGFFPHEIPIDSTRSPVAEERNLGEIVLDYSARVELVPGELGVRLRRARVDVTGYEVEARAADGRMGGGVALWSTGTADFATEALVVPVPGDTPVTISVNALNLADTYLTKVRVASYSTDRVELEATSVRVLRGRLGGMPRSWTTRRSVFCSDGRRSIGDAARCCQAVSDDRGEFEFVLGEDAEPRLWLSGASAEDIDLQPAEMCAGVVEYEPARPICAIRLKKASGSFLARFSVGFDPSGPFALPSRHPDDGLALIPTPADVHRAAGRAFFSVGLGNTGVPVVAELVSGGLRPRQVSVFEASVAEDVRVRVDGTVPESFDLRFRPIGPDRSFDDDVIGARTPSGFEFGLVPHGTFDLIWRGATFSTVARSGVEIGPTFQGSIEIEAPCLSRASARIENWADIPVSSRPRGARIEDQNVEIRADGTFAFFRSEIDQDGAKVDFLFGNSAATGVSAPLRTTSDDGTFSVLYPREAVVHSRLRFDTPEPYFIKLYLLHDGRAAERPLLQKSPGDGWARITRRGSNAVELDGAPGSRIEGLVYDFSSGSRRFMGWFEHEFRTDGEVGFGFGHREVTVRGHPSRLFNLYAVRAPATGAQAMPAWVATVAAGARVTIRLPSACGGLDLLEAAGHVRRRRWPMHAAPDSIDLSSEFVK